MVLDANNDVLRSLRDFYKNLIEADAFPLRKKCGEQARSFLTQMDGFIKDLQMQISRARLLARVIGARKTIVLANFSFHHFCSVLALNCCH